VIRNEPESVTIWSQISRAPTEHLVPLPAYFSIFSRGVSPDTWTSMRIVSKRSITRWMAKGFPPYAVRTEGKGRRCSVKHRRVGAYT
jgi:hypothetical protein